MDTINAGVKTLHPEYEINIKKWSQIDHVISGSQAVKAEGECYLPKPGAAIDKCCPVREMYSNDALYNAAYAKWQNDKLSNDCLLYTSPSPRDRTRSRMPSSA